MLQNVADVLHVSALSFTLYECKVYVYSDIDRQNKLQNVNGSNRSTGKTVKTNKHIWLYHNADEERKNPIKYFLKIEWSFNWTNLNPLSPKMLCAQSWLKSDLYLRYRIKDRITLYYWSCSRKLCMNFVFAYITSWFRLIRQHTLICSAIFLKMTKSFSLFSVELHRHVVNKSDSVL